MLGACVLHDLASSLAGHQREVRPLNLSGPIVEQIATGVTLVECPAERLVEDPLSRKA